MGSSKGLFKRRGGDVDESHTFLGFDLLALWLGILLPSPLNSFSIKAEITWWPFMGIHLCFFNFN